jgi:centrosomal protein CEP104
MLQVAASLSNLAILYNQRGEFHLAQPLYERALRILEAVHGGDHPEVAHTLTDLAVLHLEQVNSLIRDPCVAHTWSYACTRRLVRPDHL